MSACQPRDALINSVPRYVARYAALAIAGHGRACLLPLIAAVATGGANVIGGICGSTSLYAVYTSTQGAMKP
jgi:hypothetical protein